MKKLNLLLLVLRFKLTVFFIRTTFKIKLLIDNTLTKLGMKKKQEEILTPEMEAFYEKMSYQYLCNISKLEVRRFKMSDRKQREEYNKLYSKENWFRTRKEIYQRFVKGVLTPASFQPVPLKVGDNLIVANVTYP